MGKEAKKTELRGLSPQTNYTDRATIAFFKILSHKLEGLRKNYENFSRRLGWDSNRMTPGYESGTFRIGQSARSLITQDLFSVPAESHENVGT
jgi:hypothetical protein